jgi:hypothetical protein
VGTGIIRLDDHEEKPMDEYQELYLIFVHPDHMPCVKIPDRRKWLDQTFIQNYFSHKFTAQTMSEPPAYDNVQDQFLNPELVFDAEKYRLFFQERDRAFAKAIVDYIAIRVKLQGNLPIFEQDTRYYVRSGAEYRTSWWDHRVGYSAIAEFWTKRVPFIENEAKLDLRKRGFVVHGLDLYYDHTLEVEKSQKPCFKWYCTCEQHGIFARWKLGLGESLSS